MDTAMRDLERIQERDADEGIGRRAGVFAMAALVTLGLVYAIGSMLDTSPPEAPENADPLAALDRAASLNTEAAEAEAAALPPVEVDREALTFPVALLGDDRPEVEAALAAAAAEHAMLGEESMAALPAVAALPPSVPTTLPAATMATEEREEVAEVARRDPLVARALPADPPEERGSTGHEGEWTLQVISYRTRDEAEVFAEALQTRGHDAYVLESEVEDRGTFFRVRIGPFENGREAESYRRTFEREERMNTFVVRRRD